MTGLSDILYPDLPPYDTRILSVDQGHRIYLEQSGSPTGIPVLILHGGPGGASSPIMRRFFDPQKYRIILFDQRGCGKSTPHASVEHNTTQHLIQDIETIRTTLGVEKWVLFGGSWGATLGLLYAQAHPQTVMHLILRGVFLGRQSELDWFYGGGAGQFWPDYWARFCAGIPADEHNNLIAAYHRRLFSGDAAQEIHFARQWCAWENALATLISGGWAPHMPAQYAHAFARLECHYFHNRLFLTPDQDILHNLNRIAHIPGHIVQGRYDMICPPTSAWELAQGWKAKLHMLPAAGHALSEPMIAQKLVQIMDALGD